MFGLMIHVNMQLENNWLYRYFYVGKVVKTAKFNEINVWERQCVCVCVDTWMHQKGQMTLSLSLCVYIYIYMYMYIYLYIYI